MAEYVADLRVGAYVINLTESTEMKHGGIQHMCLEATRVK